MPVQVSVWITERAADPDAKIESARFDIGFPVTVYPYRQGRVPGQGLGQITIRDAEPEALAAFNAEKVSALAAELESIREYCLTAETVLDLQRAKNFSLEMTLEEFLRRLVAL